MKDVGWKYGEQIRRNKKAPWEMEEMETGVKV